jgi:hypothetical protein
MKTNKMKEKTNLLRNPATLLLCQPIRSGKTKGFTRDNLHLTSKMDSHLNLMYVDVNDPKDVSLLKRVLKMVIAREDWLNFFDIGSLSFHWTLDGQQYCSSNPHFELFMRGLGLLFDMINGTIHGERLPKTKDIENLVESLNLSIIGLGLCELHLPVEGPLHIPALVSPPFLRESHSQTFECSDIFVLPTISILMVQCLIHTLVAEIWMAEIQNLLFAYLQKPPSQCFERYIDVKEYYEIISKMAVDVLLDERNPFLANQNYRQYVSARFCPKNRNGDTNRLFAIANVLAVEDGKVPSEFLQYVVRLSPTFMPVVCRALKAKIGATLPTGETENGRLKPKTYPIFFGSLPESSREDWASAMQHVSASNTKRTYGPKEETPFEMEPVITEYVNRKKKILDIQTTQDTACLLEEKKDKRIVRYFCCI